MRVQMKAEGAGAGAGAGGGGSGGSGGGEVISGDEEIVYFCQARRRRGETVVMLTMDVNAAVTARAHASEDDVPVLTFDPRAEVRLFTQQHTTLSPQLKA